MPWVRISDDAPEHRKFLQLDDESADAAFALWTRALCYCNRRRTGGVVLAGALRGLSFAVKPATLAAKLVAVGLWEVVEGGYLVHDYHHFQPVEEVGDVEPTAPRLPAPSEARREAARKAGRRSAELRKANREATEGNGESNAGGNGAQRRATENPTQEATEPNGRPNGGQRSVLARQIPDPGSRSPDLTLIPPAAAPTWKGAPAGKLASSSADEESNPDPGEPSPPSTPSEDGGATLPPETSAPPTPARPTPPTSGRAPRPPVAPAPPRAAAPPPRPPADAIPPFRPNPAGGRTPRPPEAQLAAEAEEGRRLLALQFGEEPEERPGAHLLPYAGVDLGDPFAPPPPLGDPAEAIRDVLRRVRRPIAHLAFTGTPEKIASGLLATGRGIEDIADAIADAVAKLPGELENVAEDDAPGLDRVHRWLWACCSKQRMRPRSTRAKDGAHNAQAVWVCRAFDAAWEEAKGEPYVRGESDGEHGATVAEFLRARIADAELMPVPKKGKRLTTKEISDRWIGHLFDRFFADSHFTPANHPLAKLARLVREEPARYGAPDLGRSRGRWEGVHPDAVADYYEKPPEKPVFTAEGVASIQATIARAKREEAERLAREAGRPYYPEQVPAPKRTREETRAKLREIDPTYDAQCAAEDAAAAKLAEPATPADAQPGAPS